MRLLPDRDIRAGVWGLAAGLAGSLCCIGPSAAILLGIGSSSALVGLSIDHGLSLAGGAALLAAALLFGLRRPRACAVRPAMRWRTPALMLVSFVLAYGLLGLLAPALAARQEDAAADSRPAAVQGQNLGFSAENERVGSAPRRRLTLIIEKMECPPCAAHIRSLLKRKPFVRRFVAEAMNDQVTIDYDSSQVSAQKLVALFPAYFGVTVIGDETIP